MRQRGTRKTFVLTGILATLVLTAGSAEMAIGHGDFVRAGHQVVLGSKKFAPTGEGFGKAHPKTIFNGGVPSGLVKSIDWDHWGSRSALGAGRGSQYKPSGGYYKHSVGVRLRAYNLGHCKGSRKSAYTRLQARFQKKPRGKYGKWFDWSGSKSICKLEF
jgi:hypothetical protein